MEFCANLSWLFNEYDFFTRLAKAKEYGFDFIEVLFPYEYAISDIKQQLINHKLDLALINSPVYDWNTGGRGYLCVPNKEADFLRSIEQARNYASSLGCNKVHLMSGNIPSDLSGKYLESLYKERLIHACDFFQQSQIKVLIEPLNPQDMPGYYLNSMTQALRIIEQMNHPNLGLQFDVYHCQKIHGNLIHYINQTWDHIEHLQIASVPERNEPDTGEVDYSYLFNYIDNKGYQGLIGCEYAPKNTTIEGLTWIQNLIEDRT